VVKRTTKRLNIDHEPIKSRQVREDLTPERKSLSNIYSQDDPAREAYIDAVAVFTESLGSSSRVQALLDDKVDMLQVHEAVISAKKAYEMRSPESKTRQWLSKLSSCIVFYSSVLDMMAQHHPEYVALVWGAMKFFLVVSIKMYDRPAPSEK
jgi:hypothetical protein